MQTFLPVENFSLSMSFLDNVRLGNQIYREGKTLLDGKWPNHPACKMWVGHERTLAYYCLSGVQEMLTRKYWKDEVIVRWHSYFQDKIAALPDTGPPSWLGDDKLHSSHRSNLLRKDPEHYGKFGWQEPDNLPYVWPV